MGEIGLQIKYWIVGSLVKRWWSFLIENGFKHGEGLKYIFGRLACCRYPCLTDVFLERWRWPGVRPNHVLILGTWKCTKLKSNILIMACGCACLGHKKLVHALWMTSAFPNQVKMQVWLDDSCGTGWFGLSNMRSVPLGLCFRTLSSVFSWCLALM